MLNALLKDRINSLDIREPYVWRLRLSEQEFKELEGAISSSIKAHGGSHAHLLVEEYAITLLVYIAEWYKRRYGIAEKIIELDSGELATIWSLSGINVEKYIYTRSDGAKLWLYSTYILGGLAIGHELKKSDNNRFFKSLCRIYNGEDAAVDSLDDDSRAIAFKESIRQKHSLFHYLQAILAGNLPFAQDDIEHSPDISLFLELVKKANDEVLRAKFKFEWVVSFSPQYESMSRHLRIWLNPEQVGEGLNQYLRFDRLSFWGIPSPTTIRTIKLFLRFYDGERLLESDEHSIITYSNTGDLETGFLSWNVEDFVTFAHVPVVHLSFIEIILKTDSDKEYLIQRQEVPEYIQLWRTNPYLDYWSSRKDAQKSTAVLFSDEWKAQLDSSSEEIIRKPFRDSKYGTGETMNWLYIPDKVTLESTTGKTVSLYNGVGYDHLTTRLYWDIIQYRSGNSILHTFQDEEFGEDGQEEIPVIFSPDDIIVRHFASKTDDVETLLGDESIGELEYKGPNGRYVPWTEDLSPSFGVITLRQSIRGQFHTLRCAFLPSVSVDSPIVRNFEDTSVIYMDYDLFNEERRIIFKDSIPLDRNPLVPSIPIRVGPDDESFELNIFRPTQIKEVCLEGHVALYLNPGEVLKLPYIFKERVLINDFSVEGYRQYACSSLGSIYSDKVLNTKGNYNVGAAALAFWHEGKSVPAASLDETAPAFLSIEFGMRPNKGSDDSQSWLEWNYDAEESPLPIKIAEVRAPANYGIVFQVPLKDENLIYCYPYYNDGDPWEDEDAFSKASPLSAFEVANKCGVYFFIMQPLRDIDVSEMVSKVYEPLLEKRNGKLTNDDKSGLIRLAEEFSFRWGSYGIEIN